ncbi:MAG: Maf family protein [Wujia sp.]
MNKIILASGSPRRRELLALAGYEFQVIVSEVDEIVTKTIPAEVVEELSQQKAMDVYRIYMETYGNNIDKEEEPVIIIGADTVVSVDGRILGKPKSEEEAYEMLRTLQGNSHEVYTGVTLVRQQAGAVDDRMTEAVPGIRTFHECTKVTFYPMTDAEIWAYIGTRDPMDKAGAYGIQSGAARYIRGIEGDYNNVVGLPVARLYHELQSM